MAFRITSTDKQHRLETLVESATEYTGDYRKAAVTGDYRKAAVTGEMMQAPEIQEGGKSAYATIQQLA